MTKKTKKIIVWCVAIFIGSNLFFAGLTLLFERMRTNDAKDEQPTLVDYSKVDPVDADSIVGRWKLKSELEPKLNSTIVIYESNAKYFYKETYDSGSDKTVELRKDGEKYYDVESSLGEYFLIDNNDLRLFDNEGEYGNRYGYSIIILN